jgi:hypothetical protein
MEYVQLHRRFCKVLQEVKDVMLRDAGTWLSRLAKSHVK